MFFLILAVRGQGQEGGGIGNGVVCLVILIMGLVIQTVLFLCCRPERAETGGGDGGSGLLFGRCLLLFSWLGGRGALRIV